MAERILGIEVGSSNIKIIEVSRKRATLVVQKFSLIPTPEHSISNGVIMDMEKLKEVIENELKVKKYKSKKTVLIIQSSEIIIRNTIMEKQTAKMTKAIFEMKLEAYLPIDRGQYQIDFKVLRETIDEGQVKNELLLVAVPNTIVQPMAFLIKELKLIPIFITIPSEALGSVLGEKTNRVLEDAEGVMVLDIGEQTTNITIINKGKVELTRVIQFGVEKINQYLDSAEFTDETQEEEYLPNLVKIQLDYSYISDIEVILDFYYRTYESVPIKSIYLIGGGTRVRGIRTYIRDAFNVATQILSEFNPVVAAPDVDFKTYGAFFVNILGGINRVYGERNE